MTLNNYPTVRPAQSLDFAKSRYLPPEVTFSRATPGTNGSDGTYVGPGGITMSDEDTPRFTWQNGKCKGLLIEEGRTNSNTNSQVFSTGYSAPGVTLTDNVAVAPDGTTTAASFLEQGGGSTHNFFNTGPSQTSLVQSVFVKPNGRDNICLRLAVGTDDWYSITFNLTGDGSVTQEQAGSSSTWTVASKSIAAIANGWYRISAGGTTTAGTTYAVVVDGCNSSTPPLNAGTGAQQYSGDTTKGYYLWGAQFEEGDTFATSYIPTSGSQATRGADSAEYASATTSGTVINHPFGASDGRVLIALGEGSGPVPVERVDVYSQHLDQTQVRTLAGLPITNEFWYWRVYGSEFGFETAVTNAFTDGQVTVDWGDGTPQEVLTRGMHTFAKGEGYYEVGFRLDSGTFFYPRYIEGDNDSTQRKKIVAVGPAPASMIIKPKRGFKNAKNLEAFDATVAFLDTTSSMEESFQNCDKLLGLPYFDSSNITTFALLCYNCAVLREFPLIDTSNGTLFVSAWRDCVNLKNLPLLDMSSATDTRDTWRNTALTSFPAIDLPEVTDAKAAWRDNSDLVDFPKINMDKCKDFEDAWKDCTSLVTFPANFFDTWSASPNNYCFFDTWVGCTALSATSVERILDSLAVADQNASTGSGDQVTITIDYDTGTGVPYGGTLSAGVITPTPASITTLKGKSRPWIIKLNNVEQ